jgi:hypothetical protein
MKTLTTIQVTSEEDREIAVLKNKLGLPSKKAVVLEGLRALQQILRDQQRRQRLQAASRLVREQSKKINREWAPLSTALKAK